jgi:PelA/Pel-15E family pectate lyase
MENRSLIFIPMSVLLVIALFTGFISSSLKDDQWLMQFQGFDDAIKHWQNKNGKDYQRYKANDFTSIAENLLLYQKNNGGWIENQDPLRILPEEEKKKFQEQKTDLTVSFDNRNLYSQVEYLYGVYEYTSEKKYRHAALKGLDLILSLQHSCGGWPHTVPASKTYHSHVTMADEVSSGVLSLLHRIEKKNHPFQDIPELYRTRSIAARKSGTDCLLKLQVKQADKLCIWAGQYDSTTLAPVIGRSYELASMASWESVAVVRYLMGIEDPSPEIVRSIESAVQWLKEHKISGYKIIEVPLTKEQMFDYHKAKFDRKLVSDENAPDIWARFYDLSTNEVILANRDGKRVKTYAEIDIERRTGYQWYGDWPTELINVDYPEWKKRVKR